MGVSGLHHEAYSLGGDGLPLLVPLAAAILEKVGQPNLKLQLVSQH